MWGILSVAPTAHLRETATSVSTVLSVERIWKGTEKVFDKARNRLEIATGGRQVFVHQVWRIARTMLEQKELSEEGKAFYLAVAFWQRNKKIALSLPNTNTEGQKNTQYQYRKKKVVLCHARTHSVFPKRTSLSMFHSSMSHCFYFIIIF